MLDSHQMPYSNDSSCNGTCSSSLGLRVANGYATKDPKKEKVKWH